VWVSVPVHQVEVPSPLVRSTVPVLGVRFTVLFLVYDLRFTFIHLFNNVHYLLSIIRGLGVGV